MTKSRGILPPRHKWTKVQLKALRQRYANERSTDIARDLGVRLPILYACANRMGLHKSKAFQASDSSGRILKGGKLSVTTQFKPGQAPANKGLRRPGWHRGRMRQTQFKKGRKPQENSNYVPIGTERVCTKDKYLIRKVSDDRRKVPARRWEAVHRLVWIKAHGPIPKGKVVMFCPGTFTNVREEITLDRLELASRADLARRNCMWTVYPKDLASTIHLLGQVKRRIRAKEGANATSD
jgi:hypothetical protein